MAPSHERRREILTCLQEVIDNFLVLVFLPAKFDKKQKNVDMFPKQYLYSLYSFLISVSYISTEENLDHSLVRQSRLLYKHDGSEASQDSMVFVALGHFSEASTRISITVLPRHDDHNQSFRSDNATLPLTLNECKFHIFFVANFAPSFLAKQHAWFTS